MIIMYPTPLMPELKNKLPEYTEQINNTIYWLFWSGIYAAPSTKSDSKSHAPLYVILILLIFEK